VVSTYNVLRPALGKDARQRGYGDPQMAHSRLLTGAACAIFRKENRTQSGGRHHLYGPSGYDGGDVSSYAFAIDSSECTVLYSTT
jgi:hypothetical protein